MSEVKAVPEGFTTVTPFFATHDADALVKFIGNAFDGGISYEMRSDDSVLRHATVKIGDALVMVSAGTERFPEKSLALHLYVENVDLVYASAVAAGARSLQEPADQFYGDRTVGVEDQWSNHWWIATKIEEVSENELARREAEFRRTGESS